MVLNLVALWKQEARNPGAHRAPTAPRPTSGESWRRFSRGRQSAPPAGGGRARHRRLQHAGHPARALWRPDPAASPSAQTTALTALLAAGGARRLRARRAHARPRRRSLPLAAFGALVGIVAFTAVIFAAPLGIAARCSRSASTLIGFGGGLFAHGTLTAAMAHGARRRRSAWRWAPGAPCRPPPPAAPSPSAACIRDVVAGLATHGALGAALTGPSPATASSTTSRSCCCSPPWSRSARSCAPRATARRPIVVAASASPSCPASPASRRSAMPSGAITGYIDVAQVVALRVLGLLRRADLSTSGARTSGKATRSMSDRSDARRGPGLPARCPSPRPSCCRMAARCYGAARTPRSRDRSRAKPIARLARRAAASRPAIRCSTASARPPMPMRADMPDLTFDAACRDRAAARRGRRLQSRTRIPTRAAWR